MSVCVGLCSDCDAASCACDVGTVAIRAVKQKERVAGGMAMNVDKYERMRA